MFLPILKRGKAEQFQCFNSILYIVTYHWNGLFTITIITLKAGVYNISGQYGGLSKLTS